MEHACTPMARVNPETTWSSCAGVRRVRARPHPPAGLLVSYWTLARHIPSALISVTEWRFFKVVGRVLAAVLTLTACYIHALTIKHAVTPKFWHGFHPKQT